MLPWKNLLPASRVRDRLIRRLSLAMPLRYPARSLHTEGCVVTQPPVQLSSPREWLEVYDADGQPTGQAKRRGPMHQDGDWRFAFFSWIARPDLRGPEVLVQHRAARKAVWPLRFDASAAGHVRFGESLDEAAREVREELGIAVELAGLIALGRHRQQ